MQILINFAQSFSTLALELGLNPRFQSVQVRPSTVGRLITSQPSIDHLFLAGYVR